MRAAVSGPIRSRRPGPLLAALFATAAAASAAAGQAAPESPESPSTWRTWAAYEHQVLDSALPQWSDWRLWNAAVQHSRAWGSVSLQWLRTRRFAITDDAGLVDAYVNLPAGWYVNARVQLAPDARVLPKQDYRVEVFAAANGWEPSVAYRLIVLDPGGVDMAAETQRLTLLGLGMGRYLPGWYVRARADIVEPFGGDGATFVVGSGRRYLTGVEGWVEGSLGWGREVVEVAAGPALDTRSSRMAALRTEFFPWPLLGLSAGVGSNWLGGLPARYAGGASLIVRW